MHKPHSPSTSSKTIREIDYQWAHSVRSSSLPIEHPKPPFDHKSLLTWPSVTSCRFPLANITLHNLLLVATILHDLVSIVTVWHQPPNPPWNPNKLLTDRKKMYPKIIEKHLFSHMQWISWFFWIDMKSFWIFSQSWNSRFRDFLTLQLNNYNMESRYKNISEIRKFSSKRNSYCSKTNKFISNKKNVL